MFGDKNQKVNFFVVGILGFCPLDFWFPAQWESVALRYVSAPTEQTHSLV